MYAHSQRGKLVRTAEHPTQTMRMNAPLNAHYVARIMQRVINVAAGGTRHRTCSFKENGKKSSNNVYTTKMPEQKARAMTGERKCCKVEQWHTSHVKTSLGKRSTSREAGQSHSPGYQDRHRMHTTAGGGPARRQRMSPAQREGARNPRPGRSAQITTSKEKTSATTIR